MIFVVVGLFDEFALVEAGSGAHQRHQVRCVTERQRVWADSISLNVIATPATREQGPLVTRWRSRTVAKVDSIGSSCAGAPSARRGSRRTTRHLWR